MHRIYSILVVGIWLALMGYQTYEGYLRPRTETERVTELFEPWEVFYLLEAGKAERGFFAERLFLNATSTGWIRESRGFYGTLPTDSVLLNSALDLTSSGRLRGFRIQIRSLARSVDILGDSTLDGFVVTVRLGDEKPFDKMPVPVPDLGSLRLDLPLLGLGKLPCPGSLELPLPAAPGISFRSIRFELEPEQNPLPTVERKKVLSILVDRRRYRGLLSADGMLDELDLGHGMRLRRANRRLMRSFVDRRNALLDAMDGRRRQETGPSKE